MFISLSCRLRFVFLLSLSALGLVSASAASADVTSTCFNFLRAQDYPRAETEARALVKRKGLSREEQRYAQLCLGKALTLQGQTQAALPAFQRVETLSQTTEELATAYTWLGYIYSSLNDLDRAELYDQRAIKAYRELGDKSAESSALNNLARVVEKRGDVERAFALYQASLALEPDEAKNSSKLNNIAMIYAGRQQYEQAVAMLRQAIEIDRRNGDGHSVARNQLNLGNILRAQGKLNEAEIELNAGLNSIRLVGDKGWEAGACIYLARLEEARGNKVNAKQWYGKAEVLYREIGNAAEADEIANMLAGM